MTRSPRPLAAALAALLLAACGGNARAPWLTSATPATHTKFPIAGGVHASPAVAKCDDCHGPYDTFRQFTCVGCHTQAQTDPWHTGVTGYAWSSPSCYQCHPDGTAAGIDHTTKFPIGSTSKHATVGCSDCHVNAADRTQVTCTGCHGGSHDQATAAGQHASVAATSYGYTDALCLRCHADGGLTLAGHTPFAIAPGTRHPTDCFRCHAQLRTDTKPYGADFGQAALSCYVAGCHDAAQVASIHVGRVTNFPTGSSSACAGCHPSGQGGG
ncbi:hypothetical protein [Anaeromyxobacter paludicola]|uniref:Cytochrome c family protein n=1 Tax=Anaeromyxobacter paludicola TaxID=2918171 RepID=A0ABN6N9M7_9BACT|nr:hypothetical protein [Anaeromyxobacter paludicola]BDG09950.1 hypothetical protein AMPC_30630 [Anaeromyxobacter paludicola]